MKFNGYEPTLHALTAKHYPLQNGNLSRDIGSSGGGL